jgi:hypothetical protein
LLLLRCACETLEVGNGALDQQVDTHRQDEDGREETEEVEDVPVCVCVCVCI